MPIEFRPLKRFNPSSFSIYIADRVRISEALDGITVRYRGSILYLFHEPGLRFLPDTHRTEEVQRVQFIQIIKIIDLIQTIQSSKVSLLLIEHSSGWLESERDLIRPFGRACCEYARKVGPVVLLAVKTDSILTQLEMFADRMVLPDREISGRRRYAYDIHDEQTILDESMPGYRIRKTYEPTPSP